MLFSGDLERDGFKQLFVVPADTADGHDRVRISNLLEEADDFGNPLGRLGAVLWVGPDGD